MPHPSLIPLRQVKYASALPLQRSDVYHLTGMSLSPAAYGYRHDAFCNVLMHAVHLQIRRNTAVLNEVLFPRYGYHSDKVPRLSCGQDFPAPRLCDNHLYQRSLIQSTPSALHPRSLRYLPHDCRNLRSAYHKVLLKRTGNFPVRNGSFLPPSLPHGHNRRISPHRNIPDGEVQTDIRSLTSYPALPPENRL